MASLNTNTIQLHERDFGILEDSDALAKREIEVYISNEMHIFTRNISEPLHTFRNIYHTYSAKDVDAISEYYYELSLNDINTDISFNLLKQQENNNLSVLSNEIFNTNLLLSNHSLTHSVRTDALSIELNNVDSSLRETFDSIHEHALEIYSNHVDNYNSHSDSIFPLSIIPLSDKVYDYTTQLSHDIQELAIKKIS